MHRQEPVGVNGKAPQGRKLTLNPLLVFLALAFWTLLWGPIGAFLVVKIIRLSPAIMPVLRGVLFWLEGTKC